jgi:hypothetical protein
MKTDFLGNELNVGDEVVYLDTKYKELHKGIIIKLSDTQATIRDTRYDVNDIWYDSMGRGKTCRYYNCIIKIIGGK